MAVVWYDIAIDEDPDAPGWFDIERIYCFDWDAFTDADWETLRLIYTALPGYQETTYNTFPRWFSTEDDPDNGYLWAGVEPPGLQVAGTLERHVWDDWDGRFRSAVGALPFRRLA